MADSSTVDIGGKKVKKNTLLIGGLAAAAVIIVAVYRKRQAAAAASPASAAMVTDPAGNQCATVDPSTGYCPGTAADTAAQQAAATASEAGLSGGGGDGYYYPPTTGTSSTGSALPTFTDNASWAQYAETALGSNGSDAVAAAIAKYLSGQPVTTDQQTTIEEAIAIAGYPPVTGANGNPPSMVLSSTSTSTSSTSTTSSASSGNGIQSQADPPAGDVWVIAIPNGKGGWMNAIFPTGASVTSFYQDVNYDNGYPGGLTTAQITAALSRAGGSLQSPGKPGR